MLIGSVKAGLVMALHHPAATRPMGAGNIPRLTHRAWALPTLGAKTGVCSGHWQCLATYRCVLIAGLERPTTTITCPLSVTTRAFVFDLPCGGS